MHLVYIDDSGDDNIACYTALMIEADRWYECDAHLTELRAAMFKVCGVYTSKELHAKEFLGVRGNYSKRKIDRVERVRIARAILRRVSQMPTVQIFNVCMALPEKARAFDWLLNRIDVNMKYCGSKAILIADEGKNYNKLLRQKRKLNNIPSAFGDWGRGDFTANIPITRIIEDITYRDSKDSQFIQMADLCAYALLRKEAPLPSHTELGIDQLFLELDAVLVKKANKHDPHGIIRWNK